MSIAVKYSPTSPYSLTPQSSVGIGLMVYKPIPPDSGDSPYTIRPHQQYRPDLLSYELYGTPNYWWVFAARNPRLRQNILFNFVANLTIIVPSADYVRKVAGN